MITTRIGTVFLISYQTISMSYSLKKMVLSLSALAMPLFCLALDRSTSFHLNALLISVFNFVVFVTSIICIVQYFSPGQVDHTTFQAINLILIILFYWISLSFLMNSKEYYEGFAHLSFWQSMRKIFFAPDFYVIKHWVIIVGFFINILYILTLRPSGESGY